MAPPVNDIHHKSSTTIFLSWPFSRPTNHLRLTVNGSDEGKEFVPLSGSPLDYTGSSVPTHRRVGPRVRGVTENRNRQNRRGWTGWVMMTGRPYLLSVPRLVRERETYRPI